MSGPSTVMSTQTSYKEILRISIPLIINMMSYSCMTFADRLFLGLYDPLHLAAAGSPMLVGYTISVIGYGVIWYISNIIATYRGAQQFDKLTAPMWHGFYFSIFMGVIIIPLSFFAQNFFTFFQHSPLIIPLETIQLKILVWAILFDFFANCLFGFLAGTGHTTSIMVANIIAMIVNIVLDWWLIFGGLGIPPLGIAGAGLGTLGGIVTSLIIAIFAVKNCGKKLGVSLQPRWKWSDLKTLLRFGLPSSVQLGMDAIGFTIMSLLVGKLGVVTMLGYNIMTTMQGIFYMPLYGFSDGGAVLVAQASGAGQREKITPLLKKTLLLGLSYIALLTPLLFFGADMIVGLFVHQSKDLYASEVLEVTTPLLRFLNIWLFTNCIHTIIMQFLKTLGDTRFAMRIYMILIPTMLITPTLVLLHLFENIQLMVLGILCFDMSMIIASLWRYHTGRWHKYRIVKN